MARYVHSTGDKAIRTIAAHNRRWEGRTSIHVHDYASALESQRNAKQAQLRVRLLNGEIDQFRAVRGIFSP